MKTRSLIFAIMLLIAYIGICSKYAYSYYDRNFSYDDPWSPDPPTNVEHEFTVAGALSNASRFIGKAERTIGKGVERAPDKVPLRSPPIPDVPHDRPIPDALQNVTPKPGDVLQQADVIAQTIIKIADFGDDAIIIGILDDIGYSPTHPEWRRLPTVNKLRLAHDAAEAANPGGGNDLFRIFTHKLRLTYQSIELDSVLGRFLAIPPKPSITFAEPKLPSSFGVVVPTVIMETINAIAKYCDGGMREILENYLSVKDADEILISSRSNSEALWRAYNRLSPADANASLKKIIETSRRTHESAATSNIFNAFMALPTPDYQDPEEIVKFRSSIQARIEDEHRVDAQAVHPSKP